MLLGLACLVCPAHIVVVIIGEPDHAAHLTRERVTQFKLSPLRPSLLPSVPPSAVTGRRGDFLYSSDCRSSRKGAQSSPALALGGAHAAGRVVGGRQKRVLHALFEDHPPGKEDATKSVHDHSYGHLRPSPSSIESPCRIQCSRSAS